MTAETRLQPRHRPPDRKSNICDWCDNNVMKMSKCCLVLQLIINTKARKISRDESYIWTLNHSHEFKICYLGLSSSLLQFEKLV